MSEFAAKMDQARQRLPLRRLREAPGRGPKNSRAAILLTNRLIQEHLKLAQCPRCRGTQEQPLARIGRLLDHRKYFLALGRSVLQRRAKFTARRLEHPAAWERWPELPQSDSGGRFTYGVAWGDLFPVVDGLKGRGRE